MSGPNKIIGGAEQFFEGEYDSEPSFYSYARGKIILGDLDTAIREEK